MPEKTDKFAVFSKKFAELDGEGQDKLITAAHELLSANRCLQSRAASSLSDADTHTPFTHSGFTTEPGKRRSFLSSERQAY